MRGEGSFRRKSWLNAGLGIARLSGAGAAAVVAGRFDCAAFDRGVDLEVCGETAAAGAVVENGCDTEGRRLDNDLKALEPGRIAAFIAMLCE